MRREKLYFSMNIPPCVPFRSVNISAYAVAVNPVNGCGLFQYLETFFENGISYKVFAVSNTKEIRTNSGIALIADDVIANLKGHEDEFDAMVFSCGDAMEISIRPEMKMVSGQ